MSPEKMFLGSSIGHHGRQFLVGIVLLAVVSSLTASSQQGTPSHKLESGGTSPFSKAEALLSQGEYAEAEKETRSHLHADPSNIEGLNLLGIIYTNEKEYGKARDAFEQALKLSPNSTKTLNNVANLYAAQGNVDDAEEEFRKVLSLAPSDRDANYNLALLLMTKGSPAAAIPHLQRVHPQTVETRFNLVRAYLRSGKTVDGLKTASQVSAENEKDVQLHFTLGTLLAAEKQYKPALVELQKADALQPGAFEILYNLGLAYFRSGEASKAELLLNRALKMKPDSPETLYALAEVYFEQSRPVDALELLSRAHKLAPQDPDIIFLLARISMTQNYYEDAIPLLESGLKIAPQRPDLRAALGESYFMAGKAERAIDEFNELIKLDPSARSYTFMGLSYRHLGRFDEARKYFEEGLKRDPHNAACLFNLGFIEERQGSTARADELFQQALRSNPDFSDALLELSNLRVKDKKYAEAADLLRRYVKVSRDAAAGYYKLAMVERSLHQMDAAQRDLNVFQTLSKNSSTGPYPYQHLFDYLNNRSNLSVTERTQLDVAELIEQTKKNPGQPQNLYLLAEAYLKLGTKHDALQAIAQLDQISANDYRTQTGVGVLLARYHLYDDAIVHFQNALRASSDSDDVKFDLADAYFRKGLYPEALDAAQKTSPAAHQDDSYLALLGDIYAHLGDTTKSVAIFRDAIARNPDNDQYYLSLALVQLRDGDQSGAEATLKKGLARIPASGKIIWGMGLVSILEGNTAQAADRLEKAVDLLPEWAGSYSVLGVFYYETGQIDKAREVLDRFKGSNAGGLDIARIEDALSRAPSGSPSVDEPMSVVARQQLLQLALSIADRTL